MLSTQKISLKTLNVNDLSEEIHYNRKYILGDIFRETVLTHQQDLLKQDLGGRYQRKRIEAGFACPRCGSRTFTRKGKRKRVFKCVIGKVKVYLLQVKCFQCAHRFCPYKDSIGLSFIDRISEGLTERQIDLTCHIPYAKAQNFIRLCLDTDISPITVRKAIDVKADSIRKETTSAEDKVVYYDSTKVKAGKKERGESIHLAVTARPYYKQDGRPRMWKRFMFLKTGKAKTIKESLKSLKAKAIVHDGDMDLSGCAPLIQRCLWHLPRQLQHFLWMDGLNIDARKPYVKELIGVLHHAQSIEAMMQGYRKIINLLKKKNLRHSVVHLKNAEKEITIARQNGLDYPSTSPVEREMREINRRADVGVRWSIQGIENLLLVKTYKKFT